ncbi:unnamed protein product [Mesocestoides corti]|nr:unnamed protein product [Mesocestoides corti]
MTLRILLQVMLVNSALGSYCLEGFTSPDCNNLEGILSKQFVNYSRYERPKYPRNCSGHGDNDTCNDAVFVEVNFFINAFSSISIVDMDYQIDLLLRQRWYDPRLNVSDRYSYTDAPIHLYMRDIWLPDLFFRNAKSGNAQSNASPNTLAWVSSSGMITYSQKISVCLYCHMQLWDFPMDTQFCSANIGSYGYSTKDMEFRWWNQDGYDIDGRKRNGSVLNTAVTFGGDLRLNEFDILAHNCSYCYKAYNATGNFTCLNVEFKLGRKFGFYMIYAYLPSLLVVLIAWMSFLIDCDATAARTSLGLLTVISLITQSAAVLAQLPRVSYIKAIDIWFFVCFSFVVSALLEFAFVNTAARQEARNRGWVLGDTSIDDLATPTSGNESSQSPRRRSRARKKVSVRLTKTLPIYCLTARRLDRLFAIFYPVCFGVFNVIYWSIYLGNGSIPDDRFRR